MTTNSLLCGAGTADITLPIGTPMGGFANRRSSCQGVLDPLSARALLLKQSGATFLIMTLDALAISAERAQRLCIEAARGTGDLVTPSDVRIVCSHTHSGADLSGMFGDDAHLAAYFDIVMAAVRSAVRQASDSLAPATFKQDSTEFPIGRNRRLRPGHAQVTELERAQGARIDHTLSRLWFEHEHGPIAVVFHTACHPACLGPENVKASGDFASIAAQIIEQQTGATALFLNGAAGNVTPMIGRGSTYAATRELGKSVADAVMLRSDLRGLGDPGGLGRVSPQSFVRLPLACQFKSEADIRQHATWLLSQETGFVGWDAVVRRWQQRMLDQLAAGTLPDSIKIPLSAVRIGGTHFVFLGAEVFNEYQLWQPPGVRLVTYCNGEGCYIPTAAALAGGGYEVNTSPVFYGLPCGPGEDAERVLMDAIADAARDLNREEAKGTNEGRD